MAFGEFSWNGLSRWLTPDLSFSEMPNSIPSLKSRIRFLSNETPKRKKDSRLGFLLRRSLFQTNGQLKDRNGLAS